MDIITIFPSIASLISLGVGIAVYANNNYRKTNQAFLTASICMALWLASNVFIANSRTDALTKNGIQAAFAIAAFIPTTFHFLRLSIRYPAAPWIEIIKKCKIHILFNLIMLALCFNHLFLISANKEVAETGMSIATPKFGPFYPLYNLYFLSALAVLAHALNRDRKILHGNQRLELEFLGFACIAGLVVGLCGTVLAALLDSFVPVPIAHASSVLTLTSIVAYGISVHKILAVAIILRKIMAYALLACYMTIVYLISWNSLTLVFKGLGFQSSVSLQIVCTLVVVFSMAPARKKLQRAADKLIVLQSTDISAVIKSSGEIFQAVTTYKALLSQFSEFLLDEFSPRHVCILTLNGFFFETAFSTDDSIEKQVSVNSELVSMIHKTHEPVCAEIIARLRPTEALQQVRQQFAELDASIAIGVFRKSDIQSVVLLSSRANGRIYDKSEQDGLQILCNQFAVALENAQLYTEMQDSKIRNEIMLDQLVSGVIVASPDRTITLFNHEAQRITGIPDDAAIGKPIGILPRAIQMALETTLETKTGVRNMDATLYNPDTEEESANIRMGSAFLLGHDGKPMGALLVFTDITELKGLEEQVRRTDQLSSVGTLAAGMAHEIKNPLVTIKTFSQLLPKRYNDEDFRHDFSSLVAHEVSRIDGIVNELLSFSKPAKPHLIPMKLQDTIAQTLKLTHEQRALNHIDLTTKYNASNDEIFGDAKLLSQALINLKLNAIEAIGEGGNITIGTINCNYRFASPDTRERATTKKCIRLQITDTGKGIERDKLQKIFDPFFTSKSEGTGMGLSVAHGIISEHHGVIEVESEPGRGTTFYVYIPVLEEGIAK
ncbi:nitrogen regulation protein NR(II) [Pontiella sp.]|uniref:two-component system sensor histidine kinase NtrB n=1 Tax=Pontiella sp. TaxID=2837462 RepID=UPI003561E7A7